MSALSNSAKPKSFMLEPPWLRALNEVCQLKIFARVAVACREGQDVEKSPQVIEVTNSIGTMTSKRTVEC